MITEVIKPGSKEELNKLDIAADAIKNGEVVAFPTETVYGLGANALISDSAEKIFKVKGRPSDNPLIVHIADIKDVKDIGIDIPDSFYLLADKFWPGPLTMIVKKSSLIPSSVSAGLDTVGIRMPDNELALYLIKKAGCPVAAPSANISGTVSATEARFVYDDFNGKIPYIIDGGNSKIGLESTVINLTLNPPVILRPGKITYEELKEYIPDITIHSSLKKDSEDIKNPASPGMKYKHYSPSCPVILVRGNFKDCESYILDHLEDGETVFAFENQDKLLSLKDSYNLGNPDNLEECAHRVFDYLRDADKKGYSKIYISAVKEKGIGLAIMNRLKKSAGGNIVDLKNVLFVCTGNTCRSPMAEFILKSFNIENLYVKSRGLYVCCASGMAFNSESALKNNDIPFDNFSSSQLTVGDIEDADIVLTMTEKQKEDILRVTPEFKDKVFTLKENGDIKDPFMQSEEIYNETFFEIKNAIEKRFL